MGFGGCGAVLPRKSGVGHFGRWGFQKIIDGFASGIYLDSLETETDEFENQRAGAGREGWLRKYYHRSVKHFVLSTGVKPFDLHLQSSSRRNLTEKKNDAVRSEISPSSVVEMIGTEWG